MKLHNVPEVDMVRNHWTRVTDIISTGSTLDAIKVVGKGGKEAVLEDFWYFYINPTTKQMAFKINKCYWAKGRKMTIHSNLDAFPSGEYLITFKAESNSYDHLDFLIVDYIPVAFDTPRKTLNWLEKRAAEMEALDGYSTQDLINQMGVR